MYQKMYSPCSPNMTMHLCAVHRFVSPPPGSDVNNGTFLCQTLNRAHQVELRTHTGHKAEVCVRA